MTERSRGTPKVDIEQIFAEREDLLVRLQKARGYYVQYDNGEIDLDALLTHFDNEVLDDPTLNHLLEESDPRCNNLSPLAAVRNNVELDRKLIPGIAAKTPIKAA